MKTRVVQLIPVCLFLWALPAAVAQVSDIEQLFKNASAAGVSSKVHNFGLVAHQVYLQFSNAPGHTCSNPNATAQLEYSFDDSTYIGFGSPLNTFVISTATQAFSGGGVYNYIHFNLTGFDTTNCVANAWYTGAPSYAPIVGLGAPQAQQQCTAGVQYGQPIQLVPNSLTVLTTAATCINDAYFTNTTAGAVWITLTDGNNVAVLNQFSLPANSVLTLHLGGIKLTNGVKWQAQSANAINGAFIGVQ